MAGEGGNIECFKQGTCQHLLTLLQLPLTEVGNAVMAYCYSIASYPLTSYTHITNRFAGRPRMRAKTIRLPDRPRVHDRALARFERQMQNPE